MSDAGAERLKPFTDWNDGQPRTPAGARVDLSPRDRGLARIQIQGTSIQQPLRSVTMAPARRRKNIFIDQRRIDRVKELLHAETETETIDRALALAEDLAAFQAEVDRGLTDLVGKGGFVDYFVRRKLAR